METTISVSRGRNYRIWPAATLCLQCIFAFSLYRVIAISDGGKYEFPMLAKRQNILLLLGTLSAISLGTGILSTYITLRHAQSWHKWLWVLFCCLPALFMGCLYLHSILIMQAWV